jgi:hypothetical protein
VDPPLVPVLGDADSHLTACLHPLQIGEDLSRATPQIDDTDISVESAATGRGAS